VVGENQLDTRLQDKYVNRLGKTKIRSFGEGGRFVVAIQDDDVYDVYDLERGIVASSSKLSIPSKALAIGMLNANELAIFFSNEVIIRSTRETRSVKYRKPGDKVLPDKNVVTILSADSIEFYSRTMEFLGSLVMDEAGSVLGRYLGQLTPPVAADGLPLAEVRRPQNICGQEAGREPYRIATASGSDTIIWEIKREGDSFRATRLPFGGTDARGWDTLQWAPGGQIL
jgi:hypothetical protein